jgi:AcrR family transcriptional regulator
VASEADKQVDLRGARPGALTAFDDSPRGRVLSAMVEVVAHGGYREATVDRVLERAHVGWSDFIGLFEDLDACFLATLDAGLEAAAAQAEQAAASCDPGADVGTVFEAALRAVLDAAAARPELTRLCLVDAPALGAPALERRQRGLQRFVEVLERQLGSPRPESRGAPPGLAAEIVVGGIYEVVQHKARAGEIRQLPEIVDDLRQLWLPALRGV